MITKLWPCTASTRRARTSRVGSGKWKRFTPSERGGEMSIEIEVGLENATKAPRFTEEELRIEETPKGLANPRVKRLLFAGGTVMLAANVGLFVYYHNRETTEDAQVHTHNKPRASKG